MTRKQEDFISSNYLSICLQFPANILNLSKLHVIFHVDNCLTH